MNLTEQFLKTMASQSASGQTSDGAFIVTTPVS